MRRLILMLAGTALLAAGCGTTGSGDPSDTAATPTPAIGAEEESIDAVEERLQSLARRKDAAKKAGDTKTADQLEQAMQDIERQQDEAIDEEFGTDTPYDKAIDSLPLRKPPLHVEQFVLEDDSHELVVRTQPKRFFCGRTEDQRLAAVRTYYEQAQKEMKANGINDFTLVVDSLRQTGIVKPLARAEGDRVSLTARGRGPGPC